MCLKTIHILLLHIAHKLCLMYSRFIYLFIYFLPIIIGNKFLNSTWCDTTVQYNDSNKKNLFNI